MPQRTGLSLVSSLAIIAAVVGSGAAAFAYTAGWLSPDRVTPARVVDALAPPGGPAAGHRRNHAKGICFVGAFEANGAGAALSKASVLASGRHPVVGRFNIASPDPMVVDATARVRGISLQVVPAGGGAEWRTAMINLPFFPVSSPQAFFELQVASKRKDDPDAMKRFAAAHPEIGNFGAWAKGAPYTSSYAEEQFNSLNSFAWTDAGGTDRTVRWSLRPAATPVAITVDDMKARGPNFLETDIVNRIAAAPQRWTLFVTAAEPGDPTADPSKAWPEGRRAVDVGTLVAERTLPEPDGPCRDLNFDPTVLPPGMRTSDDPFPAARSATYSVSFNRRTAETDSYPRSGGGASR